jgi:hypothetical protein
MNIFISHASSNLKEAISIKKHLNDLGFEVWMAAEDIQPGVNFAEEITKSINNSDAVVVLLSPESIASPHVKREVNLTIDTKKFLIPVLLGKQQDFVSTLPEDWKYWLTVVQILNFKDSATTAGEISDVLSQIQSNQRLAANSSKGSQLSLFQKLMIGAASGVLLTVGFLAYSQTSGSNTTSSETASTVDSSLPGKIIVAKESMMATEYANELPAFPTAIVDYQLEQTINSADSWQLRLYGVDWQTPDHFEGGTQINSCNDAFWILRWRAENDTAKIKTATGFIDAEATVFTDKTEVGGAGYISGFGCEAPFLIPADAPTNYMQDINYELQIWGYKPGL